MKKYLILAAVFTAVLSAVPAMAGVNVYITPPPIPVPIPPLPPAPAVVLPPPPPGIVIAPGPPAYWFWDDRRAEWFYYDQYRHPHYARGHVFVNDGRHFFMDGGHWAVRHNMGRHRDWRGRERRGREGWRR